MTQPSLFESTTTGLPRKPGWKTRSHDAKKLLQSTSATGEAIGLQHADGFGDDAPDLEGALLGDFDSRESGILRLEHGAARARAVALDGEFAVEKRQHDAAGRGGQRTVDDGYVAGEKSG